MPPADTPPNATFIDDPAVVSDKRLDGLRLVFFEVFGARLTFRHNFNLEASDTNPNLGFDGGVLEISTDGVNTFQDILAAVGSFLMGGYDRAISTGFSTVPPHLPLPTSTATTPVPHSDE